MADFRKLVLALAVLALIAVPASAQQTFNCATQGGSVTPIIRAEGLTELVGDMQLTCSGLLPADTPVNIQLFLNTAVTNDIDSSNNIAAATLEVNALGKKPGLLVGTNSILWQNVVIPANTTPTSVQTIRVTGIRVDATQRPGAEGIPGQIIEFISLTGPTTIPLFPSQLTVAFVADGMTFSVANSSIRTFQQCTGFNTDIKAAGDVGETANTFTLRFKENIPNALKGFAEENAPNSDASNGTRVFARFTDVPAGAKIFVTKGSVTGPTAKFIGSDIAAAGSGAVTADSATAYVALASNGVAVWEVVAGNPVGIETMTFGVVVAIPANISFTGGTSTTAVVAGGLAPVDSTAAGHLASTSLPIVRFVEQTESGSLFNITSCVTNLLFPYVTNAAGFDTGIALVNTSKDTGVFNTTSQNGTCTVYYFGAMGNGSQVPGPQTTTEIKGGEMTAFLLSQGGVSGATAGAQSFTGYVIARCNFQYAHGFAFISDLGGSKLAQGYLALVIPDAPTRTAVAFPNNVGAGEQLGY